MKNLLAPVFLLFVCSYSFAQKNITICHGGATEQFAAFASNKEFRATHEDPYYYVHISDAGKNITFKAADGTEAYGYFLKAKSSSKKFLFVFHEWYGLNDYVKKESEKLFKDLEDVNVLAIDLYDKQTATNSDDASKLMQQVKKERAEAIINGALRFAGKDADIGTIGWCFGGGWSLQAAILAGEKADACVIYYGMPEMDTEKLEKLDCEVLGIFAEQDQWINPEVVKEFAAKMEAAENDFEYTIYDAVHGFANPSNPKHDSSATQDAYSKTISFLKKEL